MTGVHLALSSNPQSYRTGARGCCTLEDARDARRAADVIGIPFYVWDMAERFQRDVVDDFVAEYAAGRTPNPCLRCNEKIKFAAVLDRALALGFDAVCTGHYAQTSPDGALQRAVDPGKDQSYVLAVLTPDQIAHAMFPLGDTPKAQVREEARPAACWWRTSRTATTSASSPTATPAASWPAAGRGPGQIVDTDGAVLGEHEGAYGFTVGQRKGLHLDRPARRQAPLRAVIEPVSNTVTVGPAEALDVSEITAIRPVWTGCPPPVAPVECLVQLRAHGEVHACMAGLDGDELRIEPARPGPRRGHGPGRRALRRRHACSAAPRSRHRRPAERLPSVRRQPGRQDAVQLWAGSIPGRTPCRSS